MNLFLYFRDASKSVTNRNSVDFPFIDYFNNDQDSVHINETNDIEFYSDDKVIYFILIKLILISSAINSNHKVFKPNQLGYFKVSQKLELHFTVIIEKK